MIKTNVMRMLDNAGIVYQVHTYAVDESDLSGRHAAALMGISEEQLFKTLVLKGEKYGYFVCCIPCNEELDLKKAAKAFGEKKAEMLHLKDLLPVTGYVRGGCSPIGMKKKYPTILDETAVLFDTILISAGMRGISVELNPDTLAQYVDAKMCDILKEN